MNKETNNVRQRRNAGTKKVENDDDESEDERPMLTEGVTMPGQLQQGPCLLFFYPFDAWSSRKWALAKVKYHRDRLSKIYRAVSERSQLEIEKDEEKILEHVK